MTRLSLLTKKARLDSPYTRGEMGVWPGPETSPETTSFLVVRRAVAEGPTVSKPLRVAKTSDLPRQLEVAEDAPTPLWWLTWPTAWRKSTASLVETAVIFTLW